MLRRDDHCCLILHVGEGIPRNGDWCSGTTANGEATHLCTGLVLDL
jgi:hypothetical protein